MSRGTWILRSPSRAGIVALALALVTVGAGYGVEAVVDAQGPEPIGPGVVTVPMSIEYSEFSIDHLRVRPGTIVQFEVDNFDPIHHELVVGPAEVHERHEHGTERAHPPVPGEVSLPPQSSGMTFIRLDEPGTVAFACHLPGHVAYGMTGTIEVVG